MCDLPTTMKDNFCDLSVQGQLFSIVSSVTDMFEVRSSRNEGGGRLIALNNFENMPSP